VDAPVPLILAALAAAACLVGPSPRLRAGAMLAALGLTAAILLSSVWDREQLDPLRDRPAVAAVAALAGLAATGALGALLARRPLLLPVLAVAAIPFRVPIASGGTTANLLVPLYLVVGAGALAYAVPRLLGRAGSEDGEEDRRPGALEWLLAATVVLYAAQATYSSDFDKALENVAFFYVPFTVLFGLLARVRWDARLALRCLGVLVALAVAFAAIGWVEYATRHVLLNPKVVASNQFESYFRVNSLFFDPNIYGRFLAVVMLGVTAVLLWARRTRDAWLAGAVLAFLWSGLLLSLSQSSFAALLLGLAVLAGLRWSPRGALGATAAAVAVGAAVVLAAPGAINLELGDSGSLDSATSGRVELVEGGLRLFGDRPLEGGGSGSFSREYRRAEDASGEQAVSASHTIPITVAAEQGAGGLLLYLALLVAAFRRLFAGARAAPARAAVAAAFAGLVLHTKVYAAFLEDPLAWALLGAGTALAAAPRPGRA
jgi:O-antigen ligase